VTRALKGAGSLQTVTSFFIICLAILASPSHSALADTIKVGIVDTYTGPASYFSLDVLDGFTFAVNKINAKGGVLGKKIEYFTRDDEYKPDLSLTMAKELILKEDVDVLMGTINSGSALVVSDLAKKEKIPFFVTHTKISKVTMEKGHRYVFQMTDNSDMAGRVAGKVLAKKPFLKYWIAGDDDGYSHDIAETVWKNLKKNNPKVQMIGQSWWKMGETDFYPYIQQIMAAKPDFIITAVAAVTAAGFPRAAKMSGLTQKIPYYEQTAIEHGVICSQGNETPENVYGGTSYLWYYPATPANRTFANEYYKQYKKYPTESSLDGYITAMFIAEGFKKAGKIDKEAFINAIEGWSIDSPLGHLTIRACDHQLGRPLYFGVTKKDPRFDFLIADDIEVVAAKDAMAPCSQILRLRKK
jgi:branched-chain amino acid transport system substrate-binding protein